MSNIIKSILVSASSTISVATFPSVTTNLEIYNEGPDNVFFQTDNETVNITNGILVPSGKSYKAWLNVLKVNLLCDSGETAQVRVIGQM